MDLWTTLWIAWGALFVVIEGAALYRARDQARGGTLSEFVWSWAGVRSPHWTWRRWLLLAFLSWLLVHLAFGWLSL